MRGRHPAAIPDVLVRATLANVLTLGSGGLGDDGKGLAWIENLPAAAPVGRKDIKRSFQQLSAAVLFRAGRCDEANGLIREAIATDGGSPDFEEDILLAMASIRSGDRAEARSHLGRLGDEGPDGPASYLWWNVRARRLLRREAVRLIFDGDFPAASFAP
jgi:hypothetical protein